MKQWAKIAVGSAVTLTGIVLTTGIGLGVYIYNKISYKVLSYNVQSLDQNGITIRLVFEITNDSIFDIDLWNQHYNVFVSGYKVSEITSKDRYKILANSTTLLPLDVQLFWSELQANVAPIGSQLQVTTLASLPIWIRGSLSAKIGTIRIKNIPVRWQTFVGQFLP